MPHHSAHSVKLTPDQINQLPRLAYSGPIHMISTRDAVHKAVQHLKREHLLGFDIESRPAFRKGESYPPALLQLAGHDAVYLFHLAVIGLPHELTALMSDPEIIKAGVATGRDVKDLKKLTPFEAHGFVDLGIYAERSGIAHHGLRGLAAVLLGGRVSKGSRLTNWERRDLPQQALLYAATDAWLGLRLYQRMEELGCFAGTEVKRRGVREWLRRAVSFLTSPRRRAGSQH